MNQTLILTIAILVIISLLFILVAINGKKITNKRKAKLYEKLGDLKGPSESDEVLVRRDTIIKLDNLLSKAFQYRFSNEKSCGENLKAAKKYFKRKEYQSVWDVHKLRNNIVHKDLDISKNESVNAYRIYKMSISRILK